MGIFNLSIVFLGLYCCVPCTRCRKMQSVSFLCEFDDMHQCRLRCTKLAHGRRCRCIIPDSCRCRDSDATAQLIYTLQRMSVVTQCRRINHGNVIYFCCAPLFSFYFFFSISILFSFGWHLCDMEMVCVATVLPQLGRIDDMLWYAQMTTVSLFPMTRVC